MEPPRHRPERTADAGGAEGRTPRPRLRLVLRLDVRPPETRSAARDHRTAAAGSGDVGPDADDIIRSCRGSRVRRHGTRTAFGARTSGSCDFTWRPWTSAGPPSVIAAPIPCPTGRPTRTATTSTRRGSRPGPPDVSARRVFGLPVRVDVETRPGVVVLETYTERDTNKPPPGAR